MAEATRGRKGRTSKRKAPEAASGELFDITAKLRTAPCVPGLRDAIAIWRAAGYPRVTATTRRLLAWWFERDHISNGVRFAYHRAQREALEALVYVWECERVRTRRALLERWGTEVENIAIPPDDGFARYCTKMATGSGKTKVIALAVAWQLLNAQCERDEVAREYARTFLLIAPNVIVLERLKTDFAGSSIFNSDPIVPTDMRSRWELDCVIRGDGERGHSAGMLFLTNIQQLYDKHKPSNDEEPGAITAVLGRGTPRKTQEGSEFTERVAAHGGPLLVINDEAHHTHDEEREWAKVVRGVHNRIPVVAQLDFSATPRFPEGGLFPWTISDYPLKQAIIDQIVKRPMRGVAQINEVNSSQASIRYQGYLVAGVERWKEYREQIAPLGKKPILFIMMNDTTEADDVADWLRVRYPDLLGGDRTLTIHTNVSGEITKGHIDRARRLARDVDEGTNEVSAIVSVMMLREGWDVQNVTVVVGLRPFTARAKILPEQAIGRGLRLMFRGLGSGYRERVDIVGNPKFLEFVDDLERLEDVQFGRFELGKEKVGIVTIAPQADRAAFDVALPVLSPVLVRKRRIADEIAALDISKLIFPVIPIRAGDEASRKFKFEGFDVITLAKEIEREYEVREPQTAQEVIGFYARRIAEIVKLPSQFSIIAPQVRDFFETRAFGRRVDLTEPAIVRAMATPIAHFVTVKSFSTALGSAVIGEFAPEVLQPARPLSSCPAFPWSPLVHQAEHTVFNLVPCENEFERAFACFLDRAADVRAFAKLPMRFGFSIEYLSEAKNLRSYYPDFVAVNTAGGHFLLDTRGRDATEARLKKQAAVRWCENASALNGTRWVYRKVRQHEFEALAPSVLEELITARSGGDEIVELVEAGRVTEARGEVEALAPRTRAANPWSIVLAEPRVTRVAATGRGDFAGNAAWLTEHRRDYRGKWVALRDGALLGSDLNRAALVALLEKSGSLDGALLVKVDF